jgi:hypothetical protein
MKVSAQVLEEQGTQLTRELLDLFERYNLHDSNSKLVVHTNGFRLEVDGLRGCRPECVITETIVLPNGKVINRQRCDPNC